MTRWTRLAPSPTGALHLGNARTFLITWAAARAAGWRVALRIDDLDSPRTKPGAAQQAIDDLRWLGLDWDAGPVYEQDRRADHAAARDRLITAGLAYPCAATRREIEAAASAPNEGDEAAPGGGLHDLRYPGLYRPGGPTAPPAIAEDTPHGWRFRLPDAPEPVRFDDAFAGPQTINVDATVGDFVIWTKSGLPAYQLAVVVDDAGSTALPGWPNVTDVIRGNDLLDSTGRQALLHDALGLARPRWWHVPLVRGPDGRRLAKRHGDTRLAALREAGVSAERVVGWLAWTCGLLDEPAPLDAAAFAERFDWRSLPPCDCTFTAADAAYLLQR